MNFFFLNHMNNCGIQMHVSCFGTFEKNGKIEQTHQCIIDVRLTILFYANLPLSFWFDVFLVIVYLNNRLSSWVLQNDNFYQ